MSAMVDGGDKRPQSENAVGEVSSGLPSSSLPGALTVGTSLCVTQPNSCPSGGNDSVLRPGRRGTTGQKCM